MVDAIVGADSFDATDVKPCPPPLPPPKLNPAVESAGGFAVAAAAAAPVVAAAAVVEVPETAPNENVPPVVGPGLVFLRSTTGGGRLGALLSPPPEGAKLKPPELLAVLVAGAVLTAGAAAGSALSFGGAKLKPPPPGAAAAGTSPLELAFKLLLLSPRPAELLEDDVAEEASASLDSLEDDKDSPPPLPDDREELPAAKLTSMPPVRAAFLFDDGTGIADSRRFTRCSASRSALTRRDGRLRTAFLGLRLRAEPVCGTNPPNPAAARPLRPGVAPSDGLRSDRRLSVVTRGADGGDAGWLAAPLWDEPASAPLLGVPPAAKEVCWDEGLTKDDAGSSRWDSEDAEEFLSSTMRTERRCGDAAADDNGIALARLLESLSACSSRRRRPSASSSCSMKSSPFEPAPERAPTCTLFCRGACA